MNWKQIADWWRGFSDEDVISLYEKLSVPANPGEVVPLTNREHKALMSGRLVQFDGERWLLKQ